MNGNYVRRVISNIFDMCVHNAFRLYRVYKKNIDDNPRNFDRPRHLTILHKEFILKLCEGLFQKTDAYRVVGSQVIPKTRITDPNKVWF